LENVLPPSHPVECEAPTDDEECAGPGCSDAISRTYHANGKARYFFRATEATIHVFESFFDFVSHSTESNNNHYY
jgi:hypothetical protein